MILPDGAIFQKMDKNPKSLKNIKQKNWAIIFLFGLQRGAKNPDNIRNLTLTSFESTLLLKPCLTKMKSHEQLLLIDESKWKIKVMEDVSVAFWTHYKFSKAFKVSFSLLMHMAQVVWFGLNQLDVSCNIGCAYVCLLVYLMNERALTTDGSHFRVNMLNIFVVATRLSVFGMLDHITENENHS